MAEFGMSGGQLRHGGRPSVRRMCAVVRPTHNGHRNGVLEWWRAGLRLAILVIFHCFLISSVRGENLLTNGDFSAEDPLAGWQTRYDGKGESWYFDNYQYVSIEKSVNGKRGVLRLRTTQALADVEGVKIDSHPIAVEPNGRYRLSAYARSTGPAFRLYAEGYKWRPGVKPHPNPTIYELRKCYKFPLVFFGKTQAGTMAFLSTEWQHGSRKFPGDDKHELKDLQQKLFNDVKFLVVHVISIGGREGDVYVDDIKLERIN